MVYPTAQRNLLKALEEARENYRVINRETNRFFSSKRKEFKWRKESKKSRWPAKGKDGLRTVSYTGNSL
jgi:hypothetical protein